MDITPGIFKDSPTKTEAKRFLSSTRNSPRHRPSSSSFTSSLELLTPEPVNHSRPKSVSVDKKTAKDSIQNQQLRKSFSISDVREEDNYSKRREDEENMKRAIAKMSKLDEILKEKILKEKQIKLERLQNERVLHAEMSSMSRLGGGGDSTGAATNTDVINNTNKYLALLPPLPQLEILIERFENNQDHIAEPIFQTQYPEEDHRHQRTESSDSKPSSGTSSSKTTIKPRKRKTEQEEKADNQENTTDDKTDFIKRNIELVKDAGNLVLMTAEEKARLSELLQDLDGDESNTGEEEGDGVVELTDDRLSVGFRLDRCDVDRLSEIDNRLLSISDEMMSVMDYADETSTVQGADAWCSSVSTTTATLAQVFNAHNRIEEIEKRLERLDQEWKNKFYAKEEAHLDDATLHRLLAMYTPTVRSVRTESTTTTTADALASPLPSLAPSSGMLTRDELDSLLSEARTCLGLSERCAVDDDEDGSESSVRVDAGDMSLQNLDEDKESVAQDELLLERRDEVFDSPSPVER